MTTQHDTAARLDGFIATEDDSVDWLFPPGDINNTGHPTFLAQVGALATEPSTCAWIGAAHRPRIRRAAPHGQTANRLRCRHGRRT